MTNQKLRTRINFILLLALALPLQWACSSKPTTTEYAADKVVARSDNKSERPSWASETKFLYEDGGSWVIVGVSEVPGDSRVQAAFKMSDSSARGNLAQKIETAVLKVVENSESGLSMEDQNLKSLIREVSQSTFKNVDIDDRYWEKVVQTKSTGEQVMIMKVFSRLKVLKSDLVKMSAAQAEKSKTAPKDMKNKVESIIEKNLMAQFTEDNP